MENPIIFTAEIIGTIAFASSGAMLGIRKNLDLFGVLVLGLCVAVGGGIVREAMEQALRIYNGKPMINSVNGKQEIMTSRYLTIYEQVMNYCDAVGLGIFTVLGVYTAHGEGYDGIFFLVFLGMMTGIGGGLIRDILADTMPFILYKHIYAMAAFAGALVCVLLIHIHLYLALAAGTAVVIVIRVLATHYCWDLPRPLHEKDAHTKTKNLSENSNADDT